ncbi:hypothetical protein [Thermomonas fusca]|uniref:DUF4124 domain-containing protein n=1 Tax=Thermomonas fusca TaxID=215690 RepID=A0A5R9PC45_9GAMM|nr:hypothetical protein [Thermomonas fusca]TLX21104.1 hypothetical protein E5S66_11335 [Thermomonas fusca]
MLRFSLLLLLLASLAPMREASAQVRHCVTADGTRLYTDRRCADMGAVEELRLPTLGTPAAYSRRPLCARNVQDLAYALEEAIRSGDANRIAGLYDWAGMGTANANRVMNRLQAIAKREVVEVRPVHAGERGEVTDPWLAPPPPGPPVGLRVEQVQANGHTPARASFGLRQRMGCWWVRM